MAKVIGQKLEDSNNSSNKQQQTKLSTLITSRAPITMKPVPLEAQCFNYQVGILE